MANVFLAIPQYKKIPAAEIQRIRDELKMEGWKPMFDGLHPAVDQSIQNLCVLGHHRVRYCLIDGDGNLPRVRSNQLGIWREEYETDNRCDYFMVMDDDVSFPPEAIDILIEDNKPIICGIYTFKTDNPSYLGKVAARFLKDEKVVDDRPFKIKWFNGGFVLIKAETLLTMIDAYKDLEIEIPSGADINAEVTWALWCPTVYERELLSEDWAFSQRAREIGFDIWADLRPRLIHWDREYGFSISLTGEEEPNNIEGWMTERELSWLFWKSKKMESVVELGSWKGRSTKALLSGCPGKVYAVDHFQGDETSSIQSLQAKTQDIYKIFMENVGHFPNLKVLRMDSVEASNQIDSADMVFIDTEHTYKCASKELDAWLPKTKKLICGHDYYRSGIKKAVEEKLGEVRTFESIWFKELR